MDRVALDLKNCYEIKSLEHEFDFAQETAYAIYTPNGVMNSSLAQVFQDVAAGVPSHGRLQGWRKDHQEQTYPGDG